MSRARSSALAFAAASLAAPVVQGALATFPADLEGGSAVDLVVPVRLEPADGVLQLELAFVFDPAVLEPHAAYAAPLAAGMTLSADFTVPGRVALSLTGAEPLAGTGEVAWIAFRVTGAAGSATALAWEGAQLNGGAIPVTTVDGAFAVIPATATLSVPDGICVRPGQAVRVPVVATPADGLLGLDLTLRYDPGQLAAVDVLKEPLSGEFELFSNLLVPGEVRISLFGAVPLAGVGPLVSVGFVALAVPGRSAPLFLERIDANEGAIAATRDDGSLAVAPDADGDGFPACSDCDDGSAAVYPGAPESCNGVDDDCDGRADDAAAPAGFVALTVTAGPGGAELSWETVPGATGYDAVRGLASVLAATQGSFTDATESCLANDLAATATGDSGLPAEGDAFWYLVRAVGCGGPGTYESGSPGKVPGLRDPGIALSPASCP
jgi:hypothetical protein